MCEERHQLVCEAGNIATVQERVDDRPTLELARHDAGPSTGHAKVHCRLGLPEHARTTRAVWKDRDGLAGCEIATNIAIGKERGQIDWCNPKARRQIGNEKDRERRDASEFRATSYRLRAQPQCGDNRECEEDVHREAAGQCVVDQWKMLEQFPRQSEQFDASYVEARAE